MRHLHVLPLRAALAAAAPAVAAARAPVAPPDPLDLAWCLARATAANPELAADAAAAEAARQRIEPAGALEDPRVGYEASNVPVGEWDFGSTPLSGHQLRVSQALPFPGLLGSRRKAAEAGARAAGDELADRRVRVAAAVETAWAQLGFAQRALEVTNRNLDLLRQLARIAETKYQVGSGLQQDVLRAQVALTRLLDQRLAREAAIRRAEASLAALLDLGPETRLPRTAALAETAPVPDLEPLLAHLEEDSPQLRASAAHVDEAEHAVRVAELEGRPDVDLGLGYRIRQEVRGDPVNGHDFVFAALTVRLPVNRAKWDARVAEREAQLRRAKAAYRATRARLREAVRSRHADLRRADAEVQLLETGLVPQTRQSLESSRAGYEVDKVDFLSLVDSQVSELDAELRLLQGRSDRRSAFAALEAAVGETLR